MSSSTASASRSNYFPIPKGIYCLNQCAKYETVDDLVNTIARDREMSVADVHKGYELSQWGSAAKFLAYFKQSKASSDQFNAENKTVDILQGPQPHHKVTKFSLPGLDATIRLWGYEECAYEQMWVLDFVDHNGEHVNTPEGLTIVSVSHKPGVQLSPVGQAIARLFSEKETFDAVMEDMSQETYLIIEGAVLNFNRYGKTVEVQLPFHRPVRVEGRIYL